MPAALDRNILKILQQYIQISFIMIWLQPFQTRIIIIIWTFFRYVAISTKCWNKSLPWVSFLRTPWQDFHQAWRSLRWCKEVMLCVFYQGFPKLSLLSTTTDEYYAEAMLYVSFSNILASTRLHMMHLN